jgi:hypothetical protein
MRGGEPIQSSSLHIVEVSLFKQMLSLAVAAAKQTLGIQPPFTPKPPKVYKLRRATISERVVQLLGLQRQKALGRRASRFMRSITRTLERTGQPRRVPRHLAEAMRRSGLQVPPGGGRSSIYYKGNPPKRKARRSPSSAVEAGQ